jgi:hypothetical protein
VANGGVPFIFVADGIASLLAQAQKAAGDRVVCVAGGATTALQLLKAGRIDSVTLADAFWGPRLEQLRTVTSGDVFSKFERDGAFENFDPVARGQGGAHRGEPWFDGLIFLATTGAVNDNVGGQPIVILWQAGTASALDAASVAGGRDVGAAAAYSRIVDERTLTFQRDGERLTDVVAVNHFWFSWAAFKPETRIY